MDHFFTFKVSTKYKVDPIEIAEALSIYFKQHPFPYSRPEFFSYKDEATSMSEYGHDLGL